MKSDTAEAQPQTRSFTTHVVDWSTRAAVHVAGVSVILSLFALVFVDSHVLEAIKVAAVHIDFYRMVTIPILLEIGLAVCLWAILFATYQYVMERSRELRAPKRVALVRSRGTILTETLIVMPIFLLLTSGLAQLAINSSANVLMALATFQAGRTAWVWEPETRGGNARHGMGGDQAGVEERARIAAATVLAPAAPAEYRAACEFSSLFDDRMKAIGAGTFSPLGMAGAAAVQARTGAQRNTYSNESVSYVRAFDTSTFAERGAKKFYIAYCLTSASYTVGDGEIRTTVQYDHVNAFPWFAYIFGTRKTVGGTTGYFTEYEASYGLRPQIDANPIHPVSLAESFNSLIDSILGD